MTDLVAAVPPHEPAQDALAFASKAALGLIPILGQVASEALAFAVETRQAARQHEFNTLVAVSLAATRERLGEALDLEQVIDSDEFLAGYARASREASETASVETSAPCGLP